MIKNIIYSLLFHLILIAVIYFNFNLKIFKEEEVKEITISLVTLNGENQETKAIEEVKPKKEEEVKPEVKKEEIKKEKSPIKDKKDEVKEKPKKVEQVKPKKVEVKEKKDKVAEKIKETKPVKKIEEKVKEVKKIKEEKVSEKKEEKPKELKKEKEEKAVEKKEEKPVLNAKKEEVVKTKEESKEIKEKQVIQKAAKSEVETIANTIENLNLSPRQKFNIQSQLRRCYKKMLDENKPSHKVVVLVKASLNQDGYITTNLDEVVDKLQYAANKDYQITIDNVRKAINFCSPLRNLPVDKYDVWKEVTLEFDEDKID